MAKGLPDIPFYASPLIYGKDAYGDLDLATRKRLLASFFVLTRRLPVSYKTLAYRRTEVPDLDGLIARIRRDLVVFVTDDLAFFQSYDNIKICHADLKVFGNVTEFKKGYLRHLRKKALA